MPRKAPRPPSPPVLTNSSIDADDYSDFALSSVAEKTPDGEKPETEEDGETRVSASVKFKLGAICNTKALVPVLRHLVVGMNRVVAEAYALVNFHVARVLSANEDVPVIDRNLYYRALVAVSMAY